MSSCKLQGVGLCVDEKLPCLPRKSSQLAQGSSDNDDGGALYPISHVDRDDIRVLLHYVGYDSHFDERREERDLVNMPSPCLTTECYDLHQDLALKIKTSNQQEKIKSCREN